MRSRMHRRAGFTLIEVVLALSVLLIVGQFLFQGQRDLMSRRQKTMPAIEWYLMLHELENPAHHFKVGRISPGGTVELFVDQKTYLLTFDGRQIKLIDLHSNSGFIYLMAHVKKYAVTADQQMTIVTDRGQTFKARLLLPKKVPA
ncbi:prepilin-type cleavage/methylation domain-containing protein [Lactobacillus sp. CBA3606]|uniref:type II secretion system protein n=1 Tax=Lactobacillus sp. CBA3606 TaxID=2099789 RepID=UPI000CFAB971|nr:prepilin-type cleavage/methylation domain-containing protein [Lactobacillus sp. CBA3606]